MTETIHNISPEVMEATITAIRHARETDKARSAAQARGAPFIMPPPLVSSPTIPPHGPGSETKALLISVGIAGVRGCKCEQLLRHMNFWGVAGCRERRDEIAAEMKSNALRLNWSVNLSGLSPLELVKITLWLNPLDPFGSLVDEAIRRAEDKEKNNASNSGLQPEPR